MWSIPIPSESAEEIRCSYALEHIPRSRVLDTLAEWKRLLKPDGIIKVMVPDLLWACQNFISAPGIGRSMDYIYGGQSEPGDFHKMGFTDRIMRDYCDQAGLVVVQVGHNQDNHFENLVFHIRKSGTWAEAPKVDDVPKPRPPDPSKKWRR
jgi:predicted SAM-dependent methyltransferase